MPRKKRKLGLTFLHGLTALLPILLTIYILYWLAGSAEELFGGLIRRSLPDKYYVPGMGILVGILLILIVGMLLQLLLFQKMFHRAEKSLEHIPVVKSIYSSIRDMIGFFDTSSKKKFNKVVMVSLSEKGPAIMGLITREDFDGLPDTIAKDRRVAVYLPMSYQVGGFTIFVPRSYLSAVDMTIEEAMKFTITAAVAPHKD